MDEIAAMWPARTWLLWAAFWVAIAGFRGRAGGGRFVAGLVVGALLAHLGWCALHAEQVVSRPLWLLDPLLGQSLLFVPLGPLLLAHWSRMEGRDDDFLAASFRALPFALATARAGCVAAGCCDREAVKPI